MDDIQQELIRLSQEIRDLKTAQTTPGTSTLYSAQGTIPAGTYKGIYTWIIQYADVGDSNAPITTYMGNISSLGPYHPSANNQALEWFANNVTTVQDTIYAFSTRPIISITGPTKTADIDEYTPPSPTPTWTQVRSFNPANMGTAPGWCLMNCRLGFGITSGTYANARADMTAQRNNGTLHGAGQNPPSYLQVPVYVDTGIPEGHVVVWDKGTVYSDGYVVQGGLSYYGMSSVWGWGEFCDGVRVVRST